MKLQYFLAGSILLHVILFGSIFDIYFTSPLIHDVESFYVSTRIEPPAKRLVLFVADGLRADKFYENAELSPFLRDIILNKGAWGVSHTQIPTESRPGHVALIAGFYEDVSSVMKGWKENPVEFDSVFNQSTETWSWGSPDILPMFAKVSHVHANCYHGNTESFAGDDSSILDTWVFDRFREFIMDVEINSTMQAKLSQNRIVFFLHLLGIDSNGHSHHPESNEYLENIRIVSEGIKQTVETIENYYGHDQKTAYVFTADHGMTDWGSHGAGLPSETFTPLVAWGAGVQSKAMKQDIENRILLEEDKNITRYSWELDPSYRHDVNQADVAALMSSLLGINFPVNSVGSLPVNYLSGSMERKALSAQANVMQIAEQFRVKMTEVRKHTLNFQPFSKLSASDIERQNSEITSLINDGRNSEAIIKSKELLRHSLSGLRYYHTYDRKFLYTCVLLSVTGWIFITVILGSMEIDVVRRQVEKFQQPHENDLFWFCALDLIFSFLSLCMITLLIIMNSPWTYYVYCLLPVPVWYFIFHNRSVVMVVIDVLSKQSSRFLQTLTIFALTGLICIWLMIGSFFNRNVLSLGLGCLALLPKLYDKQFSVTCKLWSLVCLIMGIFPMLPTIGRNPDMLLVLAGGILAMLLSIFLHQTKWQNNVSNIIRNFELYLPLLSACIVYLTSVQSRQTGTVSDFIHYLSWTILCLSWIAPTCSKTNIQCRLATLYTWQMSAYILLSLSYDAVFCVVLCSLMLLWIYLENDFLKFEGLGKFHCSITELDFEKSYLNLDEKSIYRQPNLSDIRRSMMLVFFLVLAFFGVGNIASINSFDVRVVLPFVTVFDPFVMGSLLAYKVLLPYLMVTCSFCGIAVATRMRLSTLCYIVMVISDVMAMHFVFMVQDHGSWLEIGTSISHFVIVMAMITSLLIFFMLGIFLTSFSLIPVSVNCLYSSNKY